MGSGSRRTGGSSSSSSRPSDGVVIGPPAGRRRGFWPAGWLADREIAGRDKLAMKHLHKSKRMLESTKPCHSWKKILLMAAAGPGPTRASLCSGLSEREPVAIKNKINATCKLFNFN